MATGTVVSLILYCLPIFDAGMKFYLIPFRMFELTLGGFVGIYAEKLRQKRLFGKAWFSAGSLCLLLFILCSSLFSGAGFGTRVVPIGAAPIQEKISLLPGNILLLLVVLLACLLLIGNGSLLNSRLFAYLGKRSYSIFIWHQIVVAFYRYFVAKNLTWYGVVFYAALVLLLAEGSYRLVERRSISRITCGITIAFAAVLLVAAFGIYLRAGVVRDILELDITTRQVYRGMHAEYVERIYAYDRNFPEENDKINVLVVGNSFARDWANVLLESSRAEQMNLSYSFAYNDSEDFIKRVESSDYIFSFSAKEEVPQYVWDHMQADAGI